MNDQPQNSFFDGFGLPKDPEFLERICCISRMSRVADHVMPLWMRSIGKGEGVFEEMAKNSSPLPAWLSTQGPNTLLGFMPSALGGGNSSETISGESVNFDDHRSGSHRDQNHKGNRRGRPRKFSAEQLVKARLMKDAGASNHQIAVHLYGGQPTRRQCCNVPTVLKHHFGSKKQSNK